MHKPLGRLRECARQYSSWPGCFKGDADAIWLPGLGLGATLTSWFGWRILPLLAIEIFLARWLAEGDNLAIVALDTVLHIATIGLAWWLFEEVAGGSRWLDDPRSATVFLVLVPGVIAAAGAGVHTLWAPRAEDVPLLLLGAKLWLSRMVGLVVVTPFLAVVVTPILLRRQLLSGDTSGVLFEERDGMPSQLGEGIELAGLTLATGGLSALLLWAHQANPVAVGMLWATCLVLIVWACIRQGIAGGCFTATVASGIVLTLAQVGNVAAALRADLQCDLLAFCSVALLVGVSASWIRANEARYRHIVTRIPFVLYSVRMPHGVPGYSPSEPGKPRRDSRNESHIGPAISKAATVVLVSPACEHVLSCTAEELLGAFERWLAHVLPDDRELVIASLTQLCLQKQPVTCEYRLNGPVAKREDDAGAPPPRLPPSPEYRWVRDTMTPHYSEDGMLDGWEGLVEDITEQRKLSQSLRRMTTMLQVLITNLPTGVYFVQGPQGYPILANARARQLLGHREDLSAGLPSLSKVYRLHRPDGSEYPWEELPYRRRCCRE